MMKRILIIALSGTAIVLNTTTVFFAGSIALAPVRKVDAAIEQVLAKKAAEARKRVSALQGVSGTDGLPTAEISKTRNLVRQSAPYHRLVVR